MANADFLTLLDLYDQDTAFQAWAEIDYYHRHGYLPDDAYVIQEVREMPDGTPLYVHTGNVKAKAEGGVQ